LPTAEAVEERALAELFVLAGRQVSEWNRPLSDRKVEMVIDRLWPGRGIVVVNLLAEYRPFDWLSVRPDY